MAGPQLFIISGPSGAGKGTIVQGVLARRPELKLSVSCTTRPARPLEKEGFNYYFISKNEFLAKRERGEFLEWAEVHGHFYGTPKAGVESWLNRGFDVILEIDVQGASQVKTRMGEAVLIFIEAPTMAILEERLRRRSTEQEDELSRRLSDAYDELRRKQAFDAVIVNDEVSRSVEEVLQLMDTIKERET